MFVIGVVIVTIAVIINMYIIITWMQGKGKDEAIEDVEEIVDDVVDDVSNFYASANRKFKYNSYMFKHRNDDFINAKNYNY